MPERSIPEDISVAIVFGARAYPDRPSDAFADRLITAGDLYKQGSISKILISGDNGNEQYNEPEVGKEYLVQTMNIPAEDITLDFAGFRTYDTCVRAKKVFGVESAILVTQRFHLPRAIFTCQKNGIESVGVSASRQKYHSHMGNLFREFLAQQKAWYEVLFFPHDPKFLGDKEVL